MPLEFNSPPAEVAQVIHNSLTNVFKYLPPDTKGGVFGVANETGGNLVVATKVPGGVQVDFYVGKKWHGSLNYGVEVMKTW